MRLCSPLVLCVAWVLTSASSAVFADSRVFLVANQPDEYGIDHCLAAGETCGALAARSYCESHEFTQASSYRLADPTEVTGSIQAADGSVRSASYVAITCQR